MILPIYAYGSTVLRAKCSEINNSYIDLKSLISDMFETMYAAKGVGLAAPQIGKNIRLFIIDSRPFSNEEDLDVISVKKTFINPVLIEESGELIDFNEGCLSIPDLREDIKRKSNIKIKYLDEDFNTNIESYDGILARIIQHEYDHIEGILFTDKLSALRKRIIKSKLKNISKGNIEVDYSMTFPK